MLLRERFVPDKELERAAAALLTRGRQADVWDGYAPIPIELLIEQLLSLRIGWKHLDSPEGTLIPGWTDAAEKIIYLNEASRGLFDRTPGLERYTLGHEAGHRVLHVDPASDLQLGLALASEPQLILCRVGDDSRREIQAERFSAFLLMPEDLVRGAAASLDTTAWPTVYRLRDKFDVSVTAMKNRLRQLGFRTPLDEPQSAPLIQ